MERLINGLALIVFVFAALFLVAQGIEIGAYVAMYVNAILGMLIAIATVWMVGYIALQVAPALFRKVIKSA